MTIKCFGRILSEHERCCVLLGNNVMHMSRGVRKRGASCFSRKSRISHGLVCLQQGFTRRALLWCTARCCGDITLTLMHFYTEVFKEFIYPDTKRTQKWFCCLDPPLTTVSKSTCSSLATKQCPWYDVYSFCVVAFNSAPKYPPHFPQCLFWMKSDSSFQKYCLCTHDSALIRSL